MIIYPWVQVVANNDFTKLLAVIAATDDEQVSKPNQLLGVVGALVHHAKLKLLQVAEAGALLHQLSQLHQILIRQQIWGKLHMTQIGRQKQQLRHISLLSHAFSKVAADAQNPQLTQSVRTQPAGAPQTHGFDAQLGQIGTRS